jgi:NAD+ kinase
MLKRLGIWGNVAKKDLPLLCRRIIRWCAKHRVSVHVDESLSSLLTKGRGKKESFTIGNLKECDLVCIMGGDGFLLHAIRTLYPTKTPLLPVNLGSLGFNTQSEPNEILDVLTRIHQHDFALVEHHPLKVIPPERLKDFKPCVAMNDIMMLKETYSRLIHIEVLVDGHLLGEIPCDGMVVSTPTGSTAYNLSAGGPIVYPTLPVMILVPMLPHIISTRPIVLPDDLRITLRHLPKKDREAALLCVDGQLWCSLQPGEDVHIMRSASPIYIFSVHPERYFSKLRRSFHWGISSRNNG